jgi:hypothetical protein
MKFLANENFPLDAVKAVRKISHDLAWIRRDAPGSKDRDILKRAVGEKPGRGRGSDLRPRDCRLRGASQADPYPGDGRHPVSGSGQGHARLRSPHDRRDAACRRIVGGGAECRTAYGRNRGAGWGLHPGGPGAVVGRPGRHSNGGDGQRRPLVKVC